MTGAAADRADARIVVRSLKNLGLPVSSERALASGPQGHALARAIIEILDPSELILIHPNRASARSRFTTTDAELSSLASAEPKSRDLILIGGGAERGELSAVRQSVEASARLLRPGGWCAIRIDTVAAPGSGAPGEELDALLFPQLAQTGALGEAAQARAPLPASAWMLMLQAAGLEIIAETATTQPEELYGAITEHATRLAVYDGGELDRPRLYVLARKPGGAA